MSRITKRLHKMVYIEDEKNKELNDLLSPELTSQERLNEPISPDMPTAIREEVLFSIIYSSGNIAIINLSKEIVSDAYLLGIESFKHDVVGF